MLNEQYTETAYSIPNESFTGISHTHFRDYDARTGRWLNEDPSGYADGMNLYSFYPGVIGGMRGVDLTGLDMYIKGDIDKHPGFTDGGKLVKGYWSAYPTAVIPMLGMGHYVMGGVKRAKSRPSEKFMIETVSQLNKLAKQNLKWMEPVYIWTNEALILTFTLGNSALLRQGVKQVAARYFSKQQIKKAIPALGMYLVIKKMLGEKPSISEMAVIIASVSINKNSKQVLAIILGIPISQLSDIILTQSFLVLPGFDGRIRMDSIELMVQKASVEILALGGGQLVSRVIRKIVDVNFLKLLRAYKKDRKMYKKILKEYKFTFNEIKFLEGYIFKFIFGLSTAGAGQDLTKNYNL
jgi:RHS repeat-associated protein